MPPVNRVIGMKRLTHDFQQQRAEFGSYLKDLQKKRWKRQKEAAAELNISPEQFSDILRGKRLAPDHLLIRLAEKCDVPLEEILMRKYWPQLPLLTGIVEPAELPRDLMKELDPQEVEEVTRYAAFLLLRRRAEQVKR